MSIWFHAFQGDSGGPLIYSPNPNSLAQSYEQWGVVSFGYGCAKRNYPGVYANLALPEVKDWYYSIMGKEDCQRYDA